MQLYENSNLRTTAWEQGKNPALGKTLPQQLRGTAQSCEWKAGDKTANATLRFTAHKALCNAKFSRHAFSAAQGKGKKGIEDECLTCYFGI